jgi:thiol-disulfide isomerase/thioredoxin
MNRMLSILSLMLLFNFTIKAEEKILLLFGRAENSICDTIILSNHYGRYIAITDQNGKFRFELKIKDPDFLNFNIKNNNATLFLLTGDTLEMNFDNNNFKKTVSFHGLRAKINSELLSVSRGRSAPDFSFKDLNGQQINLHDFNGKYIYIDVWNSSCGPCFKEFPFLEALIENYKDRNIVFLGISLDNKEKTWLRTIERKKLKGIQLFGNGWNSEFTQKYFVKFNPRFILIDKNQSILYLSAPRPSGNIDEILNKLAGL